VKFSIVVAADKKLGIGKDNTLPWRLQGDLKFFKKLTTQAPSGKQNAVIMGRKTWDSLPERFKPLPDRLNIVVSRKKDLMLPDDCQLVHSLDEAFKLCRANPDLAEIFVIGGGEIFSQALEHSDLKRVYLTEIEEDFHCDRFFPSYEDYLELHSESDTQFENDIYYSFKILEPKKVAQKI
jgi:dihydrofolate reductase